MGGNLLEWVADISGPNAGTVRGGSWEGHEDENSFVFSNYPLDRSYGSLGFRCAYGAAQPAASPTAAADLVIHRHYSADATAKPIYRCRGGVDDHLTTANQGECINAGFRVEGSQGFAH